MPKGGIETSISAAVHEVVLTARNGTVFPVGLPSGSTSVSEVRDYGIADFFRSREPVMSAPQPVAGELHSQAERV